MANFLNDGIPTDNDYKNVLASAVFKNLELFSSDFLSKNNVSQGYAIRWVSDPLHQWSRQWEYPYVYAKAEEVIENHSTAAILDAGSGATFFPYALKDNHADITIHCCDYDENLQKTYEKVNAIQNENVQFSTADLRDLPYEDATFHLVYCISVLEHTDDYEKIITEFYRVLRPGGSLVITIDISIDGTRDISIDKAASLLSSLGRCFGNEMTSPASLRTQASNPDAFTTLKAADINSDLLPWRLPSIVYRIKHFLNTGKIIAWPPPLTVYCLSVNKPTI